MLELDQHPDLSLAEYDRHNEARACGARCDICPLAPLATGPVLHQIVPGSALVAVGEAPGPTEVEEGFPFAGASGKILNEATASAGVHRREVSVLNSIACQPPRSFEEYEQFLRTQAKRRGTQLVLPKDACGPYFRWAYDQVAPTANVVLAMGTAAQRAVERAEELTPIPLAHVWGGPRAIAPTPAGAPRWLIGSYHPAFAMRDRKWMHIVREVVIPRAARVARRSGVLDWTEPSWLPNDWTTITRVLQSWTNRREPLTLDIEAPRGGPVFAAKDGIYCIGIGDELENVIVIPLRRLDGAPWWPAAQVAELTGLLKRLFEVCPMTGQYFQYDSEILSQYQLRARDLPWRDTNLLHKATNENDHRHGLGAITRRFFDCPIYKHDADGKDTATEAETDDVLHERCARDVLTTMRAARVLGPAVARFGTTAQYETDSAMAVVCRDMSELGVPLRLERLRGLVAHYETEAARTRTEFHEESDLPKSFNPRAWEQIHKLVYDVWGYLPAIVKGNKEYDETLHEIEDASTSRDALVALIDREDMDPEHERVLWKLLEFKQVEKTRSTLSNLTTYPHPNRAWAQLGFGIAYPEWRSDVIPTGRLVARRFPMQLLQKRAYGGKNVLSIFEAPPGYRFVGGDWHQVELKLYAVFANDQYLLKAVREGMDPHTLNAASLIAKGEPVLEVYRRLVEGPEDFLKYFRQYAKIAAFREIYGGSDTVAIFHGMRAEINKATGERLFPDLTQQDVDEGHESWHQLHPETRQHQQAAVAEWRKTGCVRSPILDRRARFFFEEDVNAITNMRIQGSAAALANRQTLAVRGWLGHRGQGGQVGAGVGDWSGLCLQIHDDQRMLVKERLAEEASRVFDEAGRFSYTNQAGATMEFSCDVEVTKTM